MLALALLAPLLAHAALRAGAGKRDITPDLKTSTAYIAGFGNNRVATGVHDPLWARCVALESTAQVVLCGVDSIGLFLDDVERIRAEVARKHPRASVVVAATHVHQAPDTMGLWGPQMGVSGIDDQYNALVVSATAAAAIESLDTLHPAELRIAAADPASFKQFYDDSRPPFVIDSRITVLAFDAPRGAGRIATLVHWNNHPEALGSKNTLITSDYVHFLREAIESSGGATAVFLNGAVGGMMSPLGAKINDPATGQPAAPDTFRFAEIVGRAAADEALKALRTAKPRRVDNLGYAESPVTIPVSNKNYLLASAAGIFKGRKPMGGDPPTTTTRVGLLTLVSSGKPLFQAAMIPGELYPELSVGPIASDPNADFPAAVEEPVIKRDLLRAEFPVVVGLANDEIGYIIPKRQWDAQPPFTFGASKPWYGETNSVGPEAAPLILESLRKLVSSSGR